MRSPITRKRPSIEQKLAIVKEYKEKYGRNACATSRATGYDRTSILRWVLAEPSLQAFGGKRQSKNLHYGRVSHYPALEEEVYQKILSRRQDSRPVSLNDISTITRQLIDIHKETGQYDNFKVSHGWIFNFMSRHSLTVRLATHLAGEPEEKGRQGSRHDRLPACP